MSRPVGAEEKNPERCSCCGSCSCCSRSRCRNRCRSRQLPCVCAAALAAPAILAPCGRLPSAVSPAARLAAACGSPCPTGAACGSAVAVVIGSCSCSCSCGHIGRIGLIGQTLPVPRVPCSPFTLHPSPFTLHASPLQPTSGRLPCARRRTPRCLGARPVPDTARRGDRDDSHNCLITRWARGEET